MLSLAVFDLVYLVVSLLIFTAPAFSTSFAQRFSPYIMPLALPMAQLSMTGNQELKHTHTDFLQNFKMSSKIYCTQKLRPNLPASFGTGQEVGDKFRVLVAFAHLMLGSNTGNWGPSCDIDS